jgi:hypothetical protein
MKSETLKNPPLFSPTVGCLLIILFGILSFGPTLKVGFLWDDHEMIENNIHIQKFNGASLRHALTQDVFDGKGDPYYELWRPPY